MVERQKTGHERRADQSLEFLLYFHTMQNKIHKVSLGSQSQGPLD